MSHLLEFQPEPKFIRRISNFSIENLLRKDSSVVMDESQNSEQVEYSRLSPKDTKGCVNKTEDLSSLSTSVQTKNLATFSWLNCTRFKPPKLPRSRKRTGCNRKRYGRGPRIPFAPHQIVVLERTFSTSQYLSSECILRLADSLNLSETRVKIWFQNRRARFRREKEAVVTSETDKKSRFSPSQNISENNISPLTKSTLTPNKLLGKNGLGDVSSSNNVKRKLFIPDFLSLQIQHQAQTRPISSVFPGSTLSNYSSSNAPVDTHRTTITNGIKTNFMQLHSFPYAFSSELSHNVAAHFSRVLCGTSSSAFVPVQFPVPSSHI